MTGRRGEPAVLPLPSVDTIDRQAHSVAELARAGERPLRRWAPHSGFCSAGFKVLGIRRLPLKVPCAAALQRQRCRRPSPRPPADRQHNPCRLAPAMLWQVLFDQSAHVGERLKRHDGGNDDRVRQRARPVRSRQATTPTYIKVCNASRNASPRPGVSRYSHSGSGLWLGPFPASGLRARVAKAFASSVRISSPLALRPKPAARARSPRAYQRPGSITRTIRSYRRWPIGKGPGRRHGGGGGSTVAASASLSSRRRFRRRACPSLAAAERRKFFCASG